MSGNLIFIDTETTSLDPATGRVWELAMIRRSPRGAEKEFHVIVEDVELTNATDEALAVGRFSERFSTPEVQGGLMRLPEEDLVALLAAVLRPVGDGHRAVLVGSNPAFDAAFLEQMFRRHGMRPPWWHHQIDLVAVAVGILVEQGEVFELPYSSRALSRRFGVEPPRVPEAHTALGDARWHRAWWDAMIGGAA